VQKIESDLFISYVVIAFLFNEALIEKRTQIVGMLPILGHPKNPSNYTPKTHESLQAFPTAN